MANPPAAGAKARIDPVMTNAADPLAQSDPVAGRRAAPRLRLSLPGTFMSTNGNHPCIVTNLSRVGVQIAIKGALDVGKDGFLRCGPIDRFATIIRKDRGINALQFENPLSESFVLQMRKFQESFADLERMELLETARSWSTGENQGRW